jgi:hypothetical protein
MVFAMLIVVVPIVIRCGNFDGSIVAARGMLDVDPGTALVARIKVESCELGP